MYMQNNSWRGIMPEMAAGSINRSQSKDKKDFKKYKGVIEKKQRMSGILDNKKTQKKGFSNHISYAGCPGRAAIR